MFTECTRDTPDVFFPFARAAQRNKYVINTSGPRDYIAPALYIHNYDTIYTGLLLISLLLHVHALTNQCKLY